ncbi:hypothetical protein EDB81DRAFT_814304 [Dactylonectria macrodidyma]|uniref:Zn(2)-C6 fungal-type domain-containing protein n=1 Tax=Dactylonectria macrodidyma TaxID=307937 RepID=A0A9P9DJS4_9HYPO|nr:hypothetical protein EDB81DRAFT_814304 [Dactylonectria macrodidyma]
MNASRIRAAQLPQRTDPAVCRRGRKLRASVACDVCRARKVRCSVASDGPPCTNCRLDSIECTVSTENKPRKKPAVTTSLPRYSNSRRSINVSLPRPLAPTPSIPRLVPVENEVVDPRLFTNQQPASPVLDSQVSSAISVQVDAQSCSSHQRQNAIDASVITHLSEWQPEGRVGWKTYESSNFPDYIEPITTTLPHGTIQFLAASEAFCLPASDATRSALVDGFIRAVYPIYPIFELEDLMQLASEAPVEKLGTRFSILSYQAMLFAAIPFVDDSTCQALGFGSHLEARASLYRRTKALYDADVDDDVAKIAQALILLSLWNEGGRVERDAWYWTNCLASLIERTEPWRNLGWSSPAIMSPMLWWSCLARETHVALVVQRPPRLYRLHKYVPLESLQESAAGERSDLSGCQAFPINPVCCLTHTARLATTTARILQNDFSDSPCSSEFVNAIFQSCERELASWSAEFSEAFPAAAQKQDRMSRETGPFLVVSILLHDAAINALYLQRVLQARQSKGDHTCDIGHYTNTMRRAAIRTAVFINEALESEWVDIVPTQFFTAVLPAIPVHIVGLNSPKKDVPMLSLRCLGTCLRFLGEAQSRFGLARHLQQDILDALSRLKISPYYDDSSVSGSSPSIIAGGASSSEESVDHIPPVLEKASKLFLDMGDPFNDESWEQPGRMLHKTGSSSSRSPDNLMQDAFFTDLLDEGDSLAVDSLWPGYGTEFLPVSDLSNTMPQDMQGWLADVHVN